MKCFLLAPIGKSEFRLALPVEEIVWRKQVVHRRLFVKGAEPGGHVKVHVPDA